MSGSPGPGYVCQKRTDEEEECPRTNSTAIVAPSIHAPDVREFGDNRQGEPGFGSYPGRRGRACTSCAIRRPSATGRCRRNDTRFCRSADPLGSCPAVGCMLGTGSHRSATRRSGKIAIMRCHHRRRPSARNRTTDQWTSRSVPIFRSLSTDVARQRAGRRPT